MYYKHNHTTVAFKKHRRSRNGHPATHCPKLFTNISYHEGGWHHVRIECSRAKSRDICTHRGSGKKHIHQKTSKAAAASAARLTSEWNPREIIFRTMRKTGAATLACMCRFGMESREAMLHSVCWLLTCHKNRLERGGREGVGGGRWSIFAGWKNF